MKFIKDGGDLQRSYKICYSHTCDCCGDTNNNNKSFEDFKVLVLGKENKKMKQRQPYFLLLRE